MLAYGTLFRNPPLLGGISHRTVPGNPLRLAVSPFSHYTRVSTALWRDTKWSLPNRWLFNLFLVPIHSQGPSILAVTEDQGVSVSEGIQTTVP